MTIRYILQQELGGIQGVNKQRKQFFGQCRTELWDIWSSLPYFGYQKYEWV